MALPVDLSSLLDLGAGVDTEGPWKIGSSYYFLGKDISSAVINAVKSTAPDTSWSVPDTTGRPTARSQMAAVIENSDIYVVTNSLSSSGNTTAEFNIYDPGTDNWTTNETIISGATVGSTIGGKVAIGVRSDGDVCVQYTGAGESVMGTTYNRPYLAERISGSWTTNIRTDDLVKAGYHIQCGGGIMADQTNDRFHAGYLALDTTPFFEVSFFPPDYNTNAWTNGVQGISVDTSAASALADAQRCSWVAFTDTTRKVRAAYPDNSGALSILGFNDAASPSISVVATGVVDSGVPTNNYSVFLAVDGTTQHAAWVVGSGTGADLTRIQHDQTGAGDDTWGTDDSFRDEASDNIAISSMGIYDSVIGFVYKNVTTGTEYYDEYSLASGGVTITPTGVSATATVGENAEYTDQILAQTGVSATGAVGEEALSLDAVLAQTGVSATGAVGDVEIRFGITVQAGGVSATATVGENAEYTDQILTTTGVAATATVGENAEYTDQVLATTGVSATGLVGEETIKLGVTSQVTGVSATAVVGENAEFTDQILTTIGVSATGLVGEEALSTDQILTTAGVSASGLVGEEVVKIDVSISETGVAATGLVGNESVTTDQVLAQTGVSATGLVGTVTVVTTGATIVNVTGVSATGLVGEESLVTDQILAQTGVSASAAVGTESLSTDQVLVQAGVSATATVGENAEFTDQILAQTGVSATGLVGDVTVVTSGDTIVNVTGVGASGLVGEESLITDQVLAQTGVSATGSVGNEAISADQVLVQAGVSATSAVGEETVVTGQTIQTAGVAASGAVGDESVLTDQINLIQGVSASGSVGDVEVLTDAVDVVVVVTGTSASGAVGTVRAGGFATIIPNGLEVRGHVHYPGWADVDDSASTWTPVPDVTSNGWGDISNGPGSSWTPV